MKYFLRISILALLLLQSLCAAAASAQAQKYESINKTLHEKLATAKSPKDSILLLENIYDISLLVRPATSDSIAKVIYEVARRADDDATALDMIRQITNLNRGDSVRERMLELARTFPDSHDKSSTVAFIRMCMNSTIRDMSDEERKAHLHRLLHSYTVDRPKDIYDQVVLLHAVCTNMSGNAQGELLVKYMDKLSALIDQLPADDYVLRNAFYVQGAINYVAAEQYSKAIELDHKLLATMDSLEARYGRAGRPYRIYDANRYVVYTRMLANWPHLSPREVETYYTKAKKITETDPRAAASYNSSPRLEIYYAMAREEYPKALAYLKEQIDNPRNRIYRRQLLKYMIECARETGDREALAKASEDYIRTLEATLDKSLMDRYKELQVVYDVYEMKQQNDKLRNEKLLSQRDKSRTITLICICFVIVLLVCGAFLVRLYRRSKQLSETLIRSNKALQLESFNLRHSQAELTEARDLAEKANNFKTMFIKNMSREVTVPLKAISEYSHLIVDCADASMHPYLDKYCRLVELNCDFLSSIVNDVLHLSEMDSEAVSLNSRQVDLNTLVTACIDTIKRKKHDGIELVFDTNSPHLLMFTDQLRVQQILLNLLSNANKFTEKGTVRVAYDLAKEKDRVIISVTDTGIGIPPEQAEKVFERFYKVDENAQGVGLGLTISRMLARVLGGDLFVDTSYTHGARLVFTLPYNESSSKFHPRNDD